jgi:hypothetical protein
MRRVLGVLLLLALVGGGCVKLGNIGCSPDNSPKIHVFTAAPDSVEKGKQVMLRWEVSDASSVAIEPGIGVVELIGSKLVTVNAPTVFLLTATNRFGKAEKPCSVAVGTSGAAAVEKPPVPGGQKLPGLPDALPPNPPAGAPDQPSAGPAVGSKPTVIFKATPTDILFEGSSELAWTVIEGASVSIDQGIGNVAQSGKKTVSPAATTKYTLVAKNSKGEAKAEATVTVAAANWTGTWQCGQIKMYFSQAGNQVTGWYDYQDGKLQGTATGNTLAGTWSESPSKTGDIRLTISADGKSFLGSYGALPSQKWVCTRISSETPPAGPAALGPPPTAVVANWSGKWICGNWGTLTLSQSDDRVTGTYTYKEGKLTGNAALNKLFATWSEAPLYVVPVSAGEAEFTMSADGNSFTGRWRYGYSGDWDTWNGYKDLSNQLPPGQN